MWDLIENPLWPRDPAAERELASRLLEIRVPLERPLVVLAGWRSPPISARGVGARLAALLGVAPRDILSISYPELESAHEALTKAQRLIEQRWPSGTRDQTVELDVIGISMGGLVARLGAMPASIRPAASAPNTGPRLNIRRLLTLATPHRGARLARWIRLDEGAAQMRPGSPFLEALNARPPDYELTPYVQLRDWWVGARNCTPDHRGAMWLDTRSPLSHFTINANRRVLLDVAARLRGLPALCRGPSPPPRD